MRKIATWPPGIGAVTDVSFIDPKGDVNRDIQISDSYRGPDALVPEKSVLDDQPTVTDYEAGVISPVDGVDYETSLSYDQLSEAADIEILDDDKNIVATFSCDVAKSLQDKISGLQVYPELNQSAGLLFPYRRPEDVIYHMGTVAYPIDILFIDGHNVIKKIYKNIKPGTLGTFGCAGVKYVLEVCGGLSDRLGILSGRRIRILNSLSHLKSMEYLNKISLEHGIDKKIIVKYSNLEKTGFNNWNNYPLLIINKSGLVKKATPQKLITSLVAKFPATKFSKIYAFDFDGLIDQSPLIRVYKTCEIDDLNQPYLKIDGQTTGLKKSETGQLLYRDINVKNLANENVTENEAIIGSLNKSFAGFINHPKIIKDVLDLFSAVKVTNKDADSKLVFVTRYHHPNEIKNLICSRINLEFGDRLNFNNLEIFQIDKDADASDIIGVLRNKYGNCNIRLYSDDNLLKMAGIPVPDDIKSKAKKAYKYLDMAERSLNKSLENLEDNLKEYEKIKNKPDAIRNSKGQYNQSIRGQTRIVKDFLVKTREAIRIFNEIKDISTTFEIIDSLASAAKLTSEGAEAVFDLIEKLDNPDFHILLTERTNQYKRLVDDFKSTLDRSKQYINTEILGLVILSS